MRTLGSFRFGKTLVAALALWLWALGPAGAVECHFTRETSAPFADPETTTFMLDCALPLPAEAVWKSVRNFPRLAEKGVRPRGIEYARVLDSEAAKREAAAHPLVRAALDAAGRDRAVGSSTMSDMALLADVPAVKCGPGETARSHTPDEFLLERDYEVIGMVRRSSTVSYERIAHIQDDVRFAPGDLLDEGSGGRSAAEVHDELARIGARFSTQVSADATILGLVTLARFVGRGLSLLADMVARPRFEATEFTRVRDLRLTRLVQLRDLPAAVADRVFTEALYRGHPYGHTALGTVPEPRAKSSLDKCESGPLSRRKRLRMPEPRPPGTAGIRSRCGRRAGCPRTRFAAGGKLSTPRFPAQVPLWPSPCSPLGIRRSPDFAP